MLNGVNSSLQSPNPTSKSAARRDKQHWIEFSTLSGGLKVFGDRLTQMKGLRSCGDGCSHLSKIKTPVMLSAERSPSYTTKTPQNSQLNVGMPSILIDFGGPIRSTPNYLTDSMTTGHPSITSKKPGGVLRLMAAVIHYLWENEDHASLILPGSIPLDSPRVREELLRYLPESWNAVVDKDVDGNRSEPRAIDASLPRFGEISAARRVARTIFIGSAPHGSGQTVRGLEEMRIRLGVVQPDEQVAVFNDATKRLTERLTHLYTRAQRYWYDTHPNLRRTMEDRAAKLEPEIVEREIVRRLRQQTQRRGRFHSYPSVPFLSRCTGRIYSTTGNLATNNRASSKITRFRSTCDRVEHFRQTWRYSKTYRNMRHLRRT